MSDPEFNPLGWALFTPIGGHSDIHSMPRNDLREHEFSEDCWCAPWFDLEAEEYIIYHNSLDDREAFEQGDRQPS
jgi:hypothetical protein